RDVGRQRVHADGGPCVAAGVAVELQQEIRRAVDRGRLIGVAGHTVHEAGHLQHAAYAIEAAHGLLHAREAVQHGVSRRTVRFLGRDVPPDGADVAADTVDTGRLAGRLDDVAVPHRRHVVTDGTRRIG